MSNSYAQCTGTPTITSNYSLNISFTQTAVNTGVIGSIPNIINNIPLQYPVGSGAVMWSGSGIGTNLSWETRRVGTESINFTPPSNIGSTIYYEFKEVGADGWYSTGASTDKLYGYFFLYRIDGSEPYNLPFTLNAGISTSPSRWIGYSLIYRGSPFVSYQAFFSFKCDTNGFPRGYGVYLDSRLADNSQGTSSDVPFDILLTGGPTVYTDDNCITVNNCVSCGSNHTYNEIVIGPWVPVTRNSITKCCPTADSQGMVSGPFLEEGGSSCYYYDAYSTYVALDASAREPVASWNCIDGICVDGIPSGGGDDFRSGYYTYKQNNKFFLRKNTDSTHRVRKG